MRLEETKEPGALGEVGKQRAIVARQPAIEGPIAHAFEGMQQSQGDHLTRPEVGLGMFGDRAHLLIDLIEQRRDKLDGGGHSLLRSSQGCTLSTSVEEVHDTTKRPVSPMILIGLQETNTIGYYVRQTIGRLSDVPHDVRVLFSKRHPRGKSSAYFMSTDLTRSAQQALQGYGGRWSCEVDNFYLKTRLGLADFRVRS